MTQARNSIGIEHSIAADCSCVACGYNLRGLSRDGRCPECGQPVVLSLRPDLLIYSDIRWRRRLVLGARLVAWAMPLLIALQSLVIYHSLRNVISRAWPRLAIPEPWQTLANVSYETIALVAIWVATSTQRRGLQFSLPWMVRLLATAGYCVSILLCLLTPKESLPRGLLMICSALMGALEVAMFYGYFGRLSRRLPDAKLARRFLALGVIYAGSRVFGQALRWGLFLIDLGSYRVQTWTAFPATATSLVCKFAAMILLLQFSRRLASLPSPSIVKD